GSIRAEATRRRHCVRCRLDGQRAVAPPADVGQAGALGDLLGEQPGGEVVAAPVPVSEGDGQDVGVQPAEGERPGAEGGGVGAGRRVGALGAAPRPVLYRRDAGGRRPTGDRPGGGRGAADDPGDRGGGGPGGAGRGARGGRGAGAGAPPGARAGPGGPRPGGGGRGGRGWHPGGAAAPGPSPATLDALAAALALGPEDRARLRAAGRAAAPPPGDPTADRRGRRPPAAGPSNLPLRLT